MRHILDNGLSVSRSPYSGGNMDSSLLSNIQKLFYERIEVFATVEFNKLSIVTGIIKIALKVSVFVGLPRRKLTVLLSSRTKIARLLSSVFD